MTESSSKADPNDSQCPVIMGFLDQMVDNYQLAYPAKVEMEAHVRSMMFDGVDFDLIASNLDAIIYEAMKSWDKAFAGDEE